MAKNKKRVLVTGGAGFVGGNIAKTLLKKGYEVVVLDNLSRGFRQAVPKGVKFVHGDLRVKSDISRALIGVDQVIHTAALLVIPESFKNPELFFQNNIFGTINLLEAMREKGIKDIVFSSSAGVYSPTAKSPISESASTFPYSPYGTSKVAMEYVLHAYHASFGFNVTILRYFNPYGPGYYAKPPQHAIPVFFAKALQNQPLPVYGNGSMIRDYIYIDDLVDAHILGLKLNGYHLYNVGSGTGYKILEIVKEVMKNTKSKSQISFVKTPPGYPQKMIADIRKIRKELGWKPKVGLALGIKKTAEFFKKAYR